MDLETRESVMDYYGKVLKTNQDLKTNACCTSDSLPNFIKPIIKEIHSEVLEKFYGCGSPIPLELAGKTVLDLGCGSGRDSFIMSKLVGAEGQVIGVDMTDEQISVALRHQDHHRKQFGFNKSNVTFLKGFIEDLETIGIKSNSVDVVTSNCVINLSPNKKRVFSEIFRILKPGGELYFSDIFSDRRIPENLKNDSVLVGECLGGAMYIEDFRRLFLSLGCLDYRVVKTSLVTLNSPELELQVGKIRFYSLTIRAFKLDLEDRCEDFGQVAYYKGTIPEAPNVFVLDDHHAFEKGRPLLVCSNTAAMLTNSRYGKHFEVTGDTKSHFGLFDCAPETSSTAPVGACC
ncbi:MAG: methyltransferase domain-containing protein [Pseudomonadota bacterium]|nr:methyltransferase domain-containing protein [Pseudomonadota bacterium]